MRLGRTQMKKNKATISEEELDILRLPKRLSAVEVAKKIRLPQKSNVFNKIDLDLTPYIKLPTHLIGYTKVKWLFCIAPTQSAKTVWLQIVMADAIDQDPGPLMYINPDEKLTKKNMKLKVIDMIKESPSLAKHIIDMRKLAQTGIELDNMSIYPGWAGSKSSLSSTQCKRVVLDEIRLMALTIGDESNAIKLAQDRLTTYDHMGLGQGYGVSTPSVEGDLLHQQLTVPDTVILYWHVRCENCNKAQILDFFTNKKIITVNGTETYKCVCTACGHAFRDDDQKRSMNGSGFYAKLDGSVVALEDLPERVIFWWTSMDSPFRSFQAIWTEFRKTKDKLHDYKNFWQCWLAKFWIDDISKTSVSILKERRVKDRMGIVPSWCRVITAGIDSQKAGFYVVVRAWGENRKTRVIDAYFLECRLPVTEASDVNNIIKRDVTNRIYADDKGDKWLIGLTSIDTGGNRTKQIYEGTANLPRFIWVKGAKPTQGTTIRFNKELNLYLVRTVEYLDETEEKSETAFFQLPANIPEDFLRQWVNIRKALKENKTTGEKTVIWKHIGQFDYRMADIHSFICMDIPTSVGTFRSELEKPDFRFNPLVKKIEYDAAVTQEIEDEEHEDYEINTFKEGW